MRIWLNKNDYSRDLKMVTLSSIVYLAILMDKNQDIFSLLGVSKISSSREIRQIFKKLAWFKLYPDKNINNPNAHSDLKINK